MRIDSSRMMARGAARRDATLVTALLMAAIYFGSSQLLYFDAALLGYSAATLAACFATAFEVSCFWRRRPSAFYGRALLRALTRPQQVLLVLRSAGCDIAAQQFIARRSVVRWLAHMLLSWGALVSFAITLPLVWGWVHFEAVDDHTYRAFLFALPVARFATDGAVGWLTFHALHLAAVAVVLGAGYFLATRLQLRRVAGTVEGFHIGPLLLLLAVAVTGLALPIAAGIAPWLCRAAAIVHEATVIALLAALPYGKLIHLFIRPLHLGAQLVRAASTQAASCPRCGAATAPAAQVEAVDALLTARGFRFDRHEHLCPICRRRQLTTAQTQLLGAQFQPRPVAPRATVREAA